MSQDEVSRRSYIGGSDAAKVIGKHNFAGPESVYKNIRGTVPESEQEDLSKNRHIMRGNHCEPIALSRIKEEYPSLNGPEVRGRFDEGSGIQGEIFLRHPEYDFIGGHTDGLSIDPLTEHITVHEVKSPTSSSIDYVEKNGIPPRYYYQLQHYMGIAHAKGAREVEGRLQLWSCDEWDLITIPVDFNKSEFANLVENYKTLWENARVEDRPIEESNFKVRTTEKKDTYTSDRVDELLRSYYEAHSNFKEAKERKKKLKSKILSQSDDASRLEGEDHYATIKDYSNSTHLRVREK